MGILHTSLGKPDQAAEYHWQALVVFRETGHQGGEVWALNGLGEAANSAGHPVDALTHHATALTLTTDTGGLEQQARAHSGLGRAHHILGAPDRGRRHYQRALALYTDLGLPQADRIRRFLNALDANYSPAGQHSIS